MNGPICSFSKQRKLQMLVPPFLNWHTLEDPIWGIEEGSAVASKETI